MKIFVTGAAGFIGAALSNELLRLGHIVIGIDNINDYYDINLKFARLNLLGISKENINDSTPISGIDNFTFIKCDIGNKNILSKIFSQYDFDAVVNLAAQAGVRYSIENPQAYIDSNITGFLNILEVCKDHEIKHLLYASSSSVYGKNIKVPFTENDRVDNPASLYAVTKKTNEQMALVYNSLYGLKTTGLRFFTVYGPWGRPDMAPMLFANALRNNTEIKVFNSGDMSRDFTYVDDIVEGIVNIIQSDESNFIGNEIYNIGNSKPVNLGEFISILESEYGKIAKKIFMPMQAGDVKNTWADVSLLNKNFGYKPGTSLLLGIKQFIKWFKEYYK